MYDHDGAIYLPPQKWASAGRQVRRQVRQLLGVNKNFSGGLYVKHQVLATPKYSPYDNTAGVWDTIPVISYRGGGNVVTMGYECKTRLLLCAVNNILMVCVCAYACGVCTCGVCVVVCVLYLI
jgi:hypothetical protein